MKRTNKDQSGFTLTELMVTLALVAIIMGFAVPTFSKLSDRMELKAAARELYSIFYRAKAEAMKSGVSHTIVFGQPVSGSTYDCLIFKDDNGTSEFRSTNEIIRKLTLQEHFSNISFDNISFGTNDDGLKAVRFDPRGFPRNNSGGFGAGSVVLKESRSGHTITLTVSTLGRVTIGTIQ